MMRDYVMHVVNVYTHLKTCYGRKLDYNLMLRSHNCVCKIQQCVLFTTDHVHFTVLNLKQFGAAMTNRTMKLHFYQFCHICLSLMPLDVVSSH